MALLQAVNYFLAGAGEAAVLDHGGDVRRETVTGGEQDGACAHGNAVENDLAVLAEASAQQREPDGEVAALKFAHAVKASLAFPAGA